MRVLVLCVAVALGAALGTGTASGTTTTTPAPAPSAASPTSTVDFASAPVWPLGVFVGGLAALAFAPRRRRRPMMDG